MVAVVVVVVMAAAAAAAAAVVVVVAAAAAVCDTAVGTRSKIVHEYAPWPFRSPKAAESARPRAEVVPFLAASHPPARGWSRGWRGRVR